MSSSKQTLFDDGSERLKHGPDLTSSIMTRLGYAPVSTKAARVIYMRKWVGRTAFLVLVLGAIIVGTKLQSQSSSARHPVGPSIPNAIQHDLTYHGETIDRAIRTIKNLSPRLDIVPAMEIPKSVPIDDQSTPIQVGCITHQQFGWA